MKSPAQQRLGLAPLIAGEGAGRGGANSESHNPAQEDTASR